MLVNDNVPRKPGVASGMFGIVASVFRSRQGRTMSKSSTFGRRERKSKRIVRSSVQNCKLNVRNDLLK